jgi:hypothetical protein
MKLGTVCSKGSICKIPNLYYPQGYQVQIFKRLRILVHDYKSQERDVDKLVRNIFRIGVTMWSDYQCETKLLIITHNSNIFDGGLDYY